MSLELTQNEADRLLELVKLCQDEGKYLFDTISPSLRFPLKSEDGHEDFMLDVYNGRIELSKYTYNHRARKAIVLARLDIAGPPHRNPDDEEIDCPHLHLYKEGYADKWAYPVSEHSFSDPDDAWQLFQEFMDFCNVKEKPNIEKGLF